MTNLRHIGVVSMVAAIAYLWSPKDRIYRVQEAFRDTAPGEFIEINGVRTHYTIQGSGELIVMIHGLGSGWSQAFGDMIPHLTKTNTVLAFDLYGVGFSDGTSENMDMERIVSHLAQLLLKLSVRTKGLTVRPFTLVGYSMGGAAATGFALEFDSLIKNLILMAPAGVKVPIPVEGELIKIPIIGDLLFQAMAPFIIKNQLPRGHIKGDDFDETVKAHRHSNITARTKHHPGYVRSLLSSLRHFPLSDFEEGLRQLQDKSFPAMVIWGDHDLVCPYESGSKRILELVPRIKLHTVKDSGHDDLSESLAPDVSKTIADFANNGG
eukprot:jgi/Bigna1/87848/estExt_fgenesh1_pg.C_250018